MNLISRCYSLFESAADQLRHPLLLILRLYWGWQFVQTGWGKLTHLERTTSYFAELGLPAPQLNALAAGSVEFLGGALLIIGLASRPAATALSFTMAVAYATADRAALTGIFREPDAFTSATPFLFLLTCVVVLAFGPGAWSADSLIQSQLQLRRKPVQA